MHKHIPDASSLTYFISSSFKTREIFIVYYHPMIKPETLPNLNVQQSLLLSQQGTIMDIRISLLELNYKINWIRSSEANKSISSIKRKELEKEENLDR